MASFEPKEAAVLIDTTTIDELTRHLFYCEEMAKWLRRIITSRQATATQSAVTVAGKEATITNQQVAAAPSLPQVNRPSSGMSTKHTSKVSVPANSTAQTKNRCSSVPGHLQQSHPKPAPAHTAGRSASYGGPSRQRDASTRKDRLVAKKP